MGTCQAICLPDMTLCKEPHPNANNLLFSKNAPIAVLFTFQFIRTLLSKESVSCTDAVHVHGLVSDTVIFSAPILIQKFSEKAKLNIDYHGRDTEVRLRNPGSM